MKPRIDKIRKRDGRIVKFRPEKVTSAIWAAAQAVGGKDRAIAEKLTKDVVKLLERKYEGDGVPGVEHIQDLVEKALVESGHAKTAKAYILYREQHKNLREVTKLLRDITIVDDYIEELDWRVRENSNMTYSLQGLNVHITSKVISNYWLNSVYPKEIRDAHINGEYHIHDLGTLGAYTYFGKESVIAKLNGRLLVTSFQRLYESLKEKENLLSKADNAWAKYPENLMVLDGKGWTKATRLVKKAKKKKMHFIKNEGGRSVIVTDDHPMILNEQGETKAAKLVKTEKDKTLTVDLGKLLTSEKLFKRETVFLAEELLNRGIDDFWVDGMPLEEYSNYSKDFKANVMVSANNNANVLPNRIKLTENLGYLVGYCLAEGSVDTHKLKIKQKRTPSNKKAFERLKKAAHGLGCRLYARDKNGITTLDIANTTFVKYLIKEVFTCGGISKDKMLPEDILSYNKKFVKGIVAGVIDGDGSINSSKTSIDLRTSSRTMLEQMATVLNLLGFVAKDRNIEGVGTEREFKGRRIVQNYPLFGISFRTLKGKSLPSFKYNSAGLSSKAWRAEGAGWHKVLNNEGTKIMDKYIYDITTDSSTLIVNGMWNHNCVGWDLEDLLASGFRGVRGKIESRPAKHFDVALMQIVNFMYTLQGEAAGAQALSSFDTLLAPFIRVDNLDYKQVKQSMQKFLFNMNVPTRVGFQCLSEDTDILTPEGWKNYRRVKKGSVIKTFNLEKKIIEDSVVRKVFSRQYSGTMYNLKNRIQDQLISPGHRIVRNKFSTDRYCLEEIENASRLKSPLIMPIAAGNRNKEAKLNDEQIKLMAWIISEGTIEKKKERRVCYRVTIYQSALRNKKNCDEIRGLLKHFGLSYSERDSKASLGMPVKMMRLDAESSRKIHGWFSTRDSVKFIPKQLLDMSQRQSRIFLETYIKGDGFEKSKISLTDERLLDQLQQIIVNSGYGFTVLERPPTIGKKTIFVLRVIRHENTYVSDIRKVNYKGVIWCPNTDNETVIARRNGKVFITGNTPFTNITMDLTPPSFMKNQPVIIGGKPQDTTYGDYQKEMDMMNRAFAETMLEGDASSRPFTFPIPTYNVTKDFPWDKEELKAIWQMTAKYGIPYFANFINSDMKPDDVRSMCCRLRIDNRELKKRGGGLFGSHPLTGSTGVVTINLPRIAYEAENDEDFFDILERRMELAKESLIIKREVLEQFTKSGLYPYSKFYLRRIKESQGTYWKNHFSTIGIIGMNDALLNFSGHDIAQPEGRAFATKVLEFMRDKLADFQQETGDIFNLEATPAEGTSYRLARIDRKLYPKIKIYNLERYGKKDAKPYYTNSTQLPVGHTDDIFKALELQDQLQTKYTGGTVLHGFIGEKLPSIEATKTLVKTIAENFHLPYFTLTPTFSICPHHGYLKGEHEYCPKCDEESGIVEIKKGGK